MAQTSKIKFNSNLFKTKIWLEGVGLLAQKVLKNLQIALTDENSIPAPGEVLSGRSTYNSRHCTVVGCSRREGSCSDS